MYVPAAAPTVHGYVLTVSTPSCDTVTVKVSSATSHPLTPLIVALNGEVPPADVWSTAALTTLGVPPPHVALSCACTDVLSAGACT